MLSTLISQISTQLSTLSRAFWMSAVMPIAIALITHGLLISWLRGTISLRDFFKSNLTDQVVNVGLPLIILFLTAAQVLSMLQSLMLKTLEGKHLGPLRGHFIERQRRRYTELSTRLQQTVQHRGFVQQSVHSATGATDNLVITRKQARGELVESSDLQADGVIPQEQYEYVLDRLKAENDSLENILSFTIPRIEHRERGSGYSSAILAPTTMGNIGKTMRAYALSRYGLDLNVFWTRFQRSIGNAGASDKFIDLIQATKSQVDFAVALTYLMTVLWGGWTVWLINHGTLFHLVLVAGLGPYLSYLLYLLACQNYLVFADQMRTAVDMYRLILLKDYSMPRPINSDDEKDMWLLLGKRVGFDQSIYFTYRKDP